MKILYGVQCTGNGHVSRAKEVIPYLLQHGDVDLLLSGRQADISLMYSVRFRKDGFTFSFGNKGGIDVWDTIARLRPFRFIKDIRSCPVENYDLVISDFEPISAWACRRKQLPCLALSHQSAFFSDKTPRPDTRSTFAEMVLKYYAPATSWMGFHFQAYDKNIHTPVIRSAVRKSLIAEQDHVTVYLPAFDDATLARYLRQVKKVRWEIFSKRTDYVYTDGNITICPVNDGAFVQSMASSCGVVTGGGFETPSEVLYLGKRLFSVPMSNQYEQLCNSAALEQMGVPVLKKLSSQFTARLNHWLQFDDPPRIFYPDNTRDIISQIMLQFLKKVA